MHGAQTVTDGLSLEMMTSLLQVGRDDIASLAEIVEI